MAEKSGFWISRTKLIWDITESRFTDWLTEISIYRQTDRQTDRHTDRQTDRTSKDFFGLKHTSQVAIPKDRFYNTCTKRRKVHVENMVTVLQNNCTTKIIGILLII